MKLRTAALLGVFAVLSSVGGAMAIPVRHPGVSYTPAQKEPAQPGTTDVAHFNAGQTLTIDARLGHPAIPKNQSGETFLFAAIAPSSSASDAVRATPPLDLAIVLDRSGSMKGDRIVNAIDAATGIVERMRDGDTITVVSFDTEAITVVPPTRISATARPAIEASIRSIRLGGDTCISCGLQAAMRLLGTLGGTGNVRRMILLSDGATNHGIVDVPGLRAMAGRMRDEGFSVTTMGVGVDFDDKVMAALASESNGHHYFVENASSLSRIFSQEFDTLLSSVASDAELEIDLASGVELGEVFDRSFRREGNKVFVPFGTFSQAQEKTVLMSLRVPSDKEGTQAVASLKLVYRDLAKQADGSCGGDLAVRIGGEASARAELDPFVAARLERSRTAKALLDANKLFEEGRFDEARDRLRQQREQLSRTGTIAAAAARKVAGARPLRSVDDDFQGQMAALDKSEKKFGAVAEAAPKPVAPAGGAIGRPAPLANESRDGRAQVRANTESAVQLGF